MSVPGSCGPPLGAHGSSILLKGQWGFPGRGGILRNHGPTATNTLPGYHLAVSYSWANCQIYCSRLSAPLAPSSIRVSYQTYVQHAYFGFSCVNTASPTISNLCLAVSSTDSSSRCWYFIFLCNAPSGFVIKCLQPEFWRPQSPFHLILELRHPMLHVRVGVSMHPWYREGFPLFSRTW